MQNEEYKIDKNKAIELLNEFDSPLYVFDEDKFIDNYNHLLESIKHIYSKYNIAYSYKTNYTPYICKLVKKLGGYAEVVSGMEYRVARKIGYNHKDIIFNGPLKGQELFEHIDNGGVVNIDNLDEVTLVTDYIQSASKEKIYKIAFRVNIDIGQGYISRFGIDADNGDLDKAFEMTRNIENIHVVGIHCHVGRSRSIEAWKNRINVMFKLVDKYFTEIPEFIDLGSGMNSIMEPVLATQFGDEIPSYEEYASVIAKSFLEKYGDLPFEKQPEIITEPGTTVISRYISFLSTVKSVKKVKEKNIITIDGSICNIGDICDHKQLPISVFNMGNSKEIENANIVGYTCLEADVLYRNYCGRVAVDDIIEFRNVGSYSNVFKPPFIYPNCAMISVSKNYSPKIIKRKEAMEDLFMTYVFE